MQSTPHTRGPILAGILVALVGAALAGDKILADSEPGAVPLALIAAGGFALLVGAGRRRVKTDR